MKKIKTIILFSLIIFFSLPVSALEKNSLTLDNQDLISLSKPAVVKIVYSVKGVLKIPNFRFNYSTYNVELSESKNDFIYLPVDDEFYGTGFIVSSDGVIVTNSHIIEQAISTVYEDFIESYLDDTSDKQRELSLTKYDNLREAYDAAHESIYRFLVKNTKENTNEKIFILKPYDTSEKFSELVEGGYKAKSLYSNPYYDFDNKDIAILKIDADNLPTIPLKLSESDTVASGQKVFAFGFPSSAFFGGSDFLEPTFSQGFVNAVKKQDDISIYQIDTKVSSGSSGSPLLDVQGNVVGIISFISGEGTDGDNFGFALPVSLILEKINFLEINIEPSKYFDGYISGLKYLKINKCKKAIEEFNKAGSVNEDFSVEKIIKNKIDYCNELIESGKSNDSKLSDFILFLKSNLVIVGIFLILVIVLVLILIIKKILKRIKKDEDIIQEIEIEIEIEKEQEQDNKKSNFKTAETQKVESMDISIVKK